MMLKRMSFHPKATNKMTEIPDMASHPDMTISKKITFPCGSFLGIRKIYSNPPNSPPEDSLDRVGSPTYLNQLLLWRAELLSVK